MIAYKLRSIRMKKLATSAAGLALLVSGFGASTAALANDSNSHSFKATESQALDHKGDDNGVRAWNKFALDNAYVYVKGTVSAVSANSISVSVKHHTEDGSATITSSYTFSVDANTKVIRKFKGTAAINQVMVGDTVSIWGSDLTSGHARLIWDQSIWWVTLNGKISAVSTDSFTLALKGPLGITVSTTVKTDSSTTYMMDDGTTKTFADLAVGQRVNIRGAWDSVNSWVLAKRIVIKS